jgi:hypothetical protein
MPRLCFVIMPFSATASCSEDEWTQIFEHVFKPGIEAAGLDYECRRSDANRGNLISAIIRSLHEAHVVLADLTDQNPNVFYELGVRHTLKNRTILVAQNRQNIPFDLQPYANHIYEWKTQGGRQSFATTIRELLADVDAEPERPDNPVSDFLSRGEVIPADEMVSPAPDAPPSQSWDGVDTDASRVEVVPQSDNAQTDVSNGEALAGPLSAGVSGVRLAKELLASKDLLRLRTVLRSTRRYYQDEWPYRMESLDAEHPADRTRIEYADTMSYALEYVKKFEIDTPELEAFSLTLVDSGWDPAIWFSRPLVGDWLSMTEENRRSRFRAIQSSPAVCALKLLATICCQGVADDAYAVLRFFLTSPIESLELGGTLNSLALVRRGELLHPEAFFGYGDLAVRYLIELHARSPVHQQFFVNEADYHRNLAQFLFLWALGADIAQEHANYPLYPAYKLVPHAAIAIEAFSKRLLADKAFAPGIASVFDLTLDALKEHWRIAIPRLNAEELGKRYFRVLSVVAPADLFD